MSKVRVSDIRSELRPSARLLKLTYTASSGPAFERFDRQCTRKYQGKWRSWNTLAEEKAIVRDDGRILRDGIDTVIGSKGTYLSGGEQQRVVLARAILKNAPIVVLDEATAFADPENERLIQEALHKLAAGKTVLMIAHRLTSVVNADQIIVVEDGEIAERGTHSELLEKNGIYAKMWAEYQQSVTWTLDNSKDNEGGENV